jgi:phosphoribosyl 1,2-cyclic phosphodiesterase
MIRYAVLGSGSSGNSYLFSTSSSAVLIDAGFSFRDLCRRIAEASLDLSLVTGLCITHLHPDHCRGAGVFARKTGRAVHVHAAVLHRQDPELVNLGIPSGQMRGFLPAHTFTVGDFAITPFPTSHDSPDSVGFSIRSGNRCFTVLTDTGIVEESTLPLIGDSDILFIEANYDEPMLTSGPYPLFLKRRIAGERGHLSNSASIEILNRCATDRTRHVYFCHLSKTNNRPDVLADACARQLLWKGKTTICEHGATYSGSMDPGDFSHET